MSPWIGPFSANEIEKNLNSSFYFSNNFSHCTASLSDDSSSICLSMNQVRWENCMVGLFFLCNSSFNSLQAHQFWRKSNARIMFNVDYDVRKDIHNMKYLLLPFKSKLPDDSIAILSLLWLIKDTSSTLYQFRGRFVFLLMILIVVYHLKITKWPSESFR